jgi:dipeptidyl aminopeptidase/acylaminoacyl peptidase
MERAALGPLRLSVSRSFAVAAVAGGLALAPSGAVPRDSQPWWAPQGTMLAFQRQAPGIDTSDVFFTPTVRGGEVDIVGAGRARGFRPGSGDLLVETGSSTSVRDGSDRTIGGVPGVDATWSPDGAQIAFLQGDVLAVAAASGENVQPLMSGITPPPSDMTGPVWSPDGRSIAIATASAAGSKLLVVPVDGSAAQIAFDGGGENVNPSWSHDGSSLAFERSVGGRWTIWLVAPDGSGPRVVVDDGANDRFPQWSPTDNRLAYLSDRTGTYALYAGDPGGGAQQLLGSVVADSPARWSPSGSMLAVASTRDCRRAGVYVVDSSPPARPVRRSNQCRFDGTAGADLINTTPYADIVDGHGGNDNIYTGAGNDVAYGGTGDDAIGGGPGNDVIYGGAGNDVLSGGTGNDTIYGGAGLNKIGCGPGNDTAYIHAGDTVRDCEHVHRR